MDKTVREGVITEWQPRRSYGYAESDGEQVFLHIGNFTERAKWPEENDRVSFQMGESDKGRPCAKNIVLLSWGSVLKWTHIVALAILLVLPVLAAPKLSEWLSPWWITLCALTTSVLAAINIWLDKRFAMKSRSRVPEATLHLFELTGGWPGSFLAQRIFRHKLSKTGYQIFFWLIVAIFQMLALDLLFEGFLFKGLQQLGRSF
jgi:uncharacterized membrane protein YsdA (DUF1294 family)/cold shock CspA family protein